MREIFSSNNNVPVSMDRSATVIERAVFVLWPRALYKETKNGKTKSKRYFHAINPIQQNQVVNTFVNALSFITIQCNCARSKVYLFTANISAEQINPKIAFFSSLVLYSRSVSCHYFYWLLQARPLWLTSVRFISTQYNIKVRYTSSRVNLYGKA